MLLLGFVIIVMSWCEGVDKSQNAIQSSFLLKQLLVPFGQVD